MSQLDSMLYDVAASQVLSWIDNILLGYSPVDPVLQQRLMHWKRCLRQVNKDSTVYLDQEDMKVLGL